MAFALTLAQAPVFASHDTDESVYFEDIPAVLSVTRLSQPLAEAPAAVTVIDRGLMEALDLRELPDALRYAAGMLVGYETAALPVVTLYGITTVYPNKMQVLVDGRSVYLPATGGALWNSLGLVLDDIERIEIVRGPNAAAYGPNSFLGVINIVTRHPAETNGHTVWVRGGSAGTRDWYARTGGSRGEVDWRLSLAGQRDDGSRNPERNDSNNWDGKDLWMLNSVLDWHAGPADLLTTRIGFQRSVIQDGTGSITNPERDIDDTASHLHLRWEHSRAGGGFNLQYYYNSLDHVDEYALMGLYPVDYNVLTKRHDLEFEGYHYPGTDTRIVYGIGARLDKVHSPTFFNTDDAVDNTLYRLFGNIEHRLRDDLIVNAGAMYEDNDISDDSLSPRIALNWLPSPRHAFRLAVSRATRTPILVEEIGDMNILGTQYILASGGVDSETIDAVEVGHHITLGHHGHLDFRFFHNRLDGIISNVGGRRQPEDYANVDDATIRGIEWQLDLRPTDHIRIMSGLSLLSVNSSDDEIDHSIPRNIFSLAAIARPDDRTTIGFGLYKHASLEWLGRHDQEEIAPFVDLSIRRDFGWGSNRAFLQITGRDLVADGHHKRTNIKRETVTYLRAGLEF